MPRVAAPSTGSSAHRNLVALLRDRAQTSPQRRIFSFLDDGEGDGVHWNYAQLEESARRIAAWLQLRTQPGDRAILLVAPGLDYIAAFFGCLYAGIIAVPAYPPRKHKQSDRLESVIRSATPSVIVTTSRIRENFEGLAASIDGPVHWLMLDRIDSNADDWKPIEIGDDSLAFLQYTSGSTGDPKGVMVSHRNLLHNLGAIQHGFQTDRDQSGLIWLPPYHDMGLIGGILQPIYADFPAFLMPPLSFIQRPIRWLEAISKHRVQVSGGPDFAYSLCVDRTTHAQREGLDLSSWRLAFTGAEPIRPETLDKFVEAFGPHGFKREAFYPCYGLAEATLMVTGAVAGQGAKIERFSPSALENNLAELDDGGRRLVSSGRPAQGLEVVVVDPAAHEPLADGRIGEIWAVGDSITRGYWRLATSEHDHFHGHLANDARTFLRTGDLGFFRDGELFVAGRLKDLIILRGANVYPQDVEATVSRSHPSLRGVAGTAFAVESNGTERLAVVQELELRFRGDAEEVAAAIRQAVASEHDQQLARVVLVKAGRIPRTSSGKVQRRLCRKLLLEGDLEDVVLDWSDETKKASRNGHSANGLSTPPTQAAEIRNADVVRQWIVEHLAVRLHLSPSDVDSSLPFAAFGLDSVQLVGMAGELETWLGHSLPPTLAWDYPTIDALSRHLAGEDVRRSDEFDDRAPVEPLAIVGIGCRFPGADGVEQFWDLIVNGRDGVGEVPPDRWDFNELHDPNPDAPGKVATPRGGFLRDIDRFDPRFFGISPREASRLDPQQRLLLEVAWATMENAGLTPERTSGTKTGVFVGIGGSDYGNIIRDADSSLQQIDAYVGTGNALSIAANRISYALDLHGPSLSVDTACSSALVALHYAAQSLRNRDCDMAFAGGVNAILTPHVSVAFSKARMLSPDGRCASFDADANGYVRGEGCGLVLLKRLSDAVRDGDQILAVLRGTSVNQDGKTTGITAPNGPAQAECVRNALRRSGLSPTQVGYVEAHGTGTPLGDPIEFGALQESLGGVGRAGCFLGSVKANIGHTETASGVASLIKVALMLRYGTIPPQRNFKTLNPHIADGGKPFKIATETTPWPAIDGRRIAGVSSFGFGGTNAHVIVEEAPRAFLPADQESKEPDRLNQVLTLSAFSESALKRLAISYADRLAVGDLDFADVCYTANVRRASLPFKLCIPADSTSDAVAKLRRYAEAGKAPDSATGVVRNRSRAKVAFLFTGQGSQYEGMGRRLLSTEPVFRKSMQQCAEILKPILGVNLLDVINPPAESHGLIDQTGFTQPALFAFEASLFQLWKSWGVEPAAVLGHSVGEYAAAFAAGVFSLEDGLRLIAERARLMQSLPEGGAMAAVLAKPDVVEPSLVPFGGRLSIAAFNGPESVVVSGEKAALDEWSSQIAAMGIAVQPLRVSHAFHSVLLDPMLDEFEKFAARLSFRAPNVPFISNLSGRALTTAPDSKYWRDHSRSPVQFHAGMKAIEEFGCDVLLEVGPAPNLLAMGRKCIDGKRAVWAPSVRPNQDDAKTIVSAVAQLSAKGASIDWARFDRGRKRRHVWLPTYSFDRERFWFEFERKKSDVVASLAGDRPLLGGRAPSALPSAQFLGEASLSRYPFLRDHVVQGSVVVPGAAYLDLALAAAEEVFGPGPNGLEDVAFQTALFLNEDSKQTLQVVVSPEVAGRASFQIFSRPANLTSESWTMHASGVIRPQRGESSSSSNIDVQSLRSAGVESVGRDELYRRLRERGLEYGPAFQGIRDVAKTPGRFAVARLDLPERVRKDAAAHAVHPAIGDLFLQLLGGAIPEECIRPGSGETYLPVGLKSLRVFGDVSKAATIAATLLTDVERDGSDRIRGDVVVHDADGRVLAEIEGAEVQRIGRTSGASNDRIGADWTYEVAWNERPIAVAEQEAVRGNWLAFIDGDDAVVEAALDVAAEHGASPTIVRMDDSWTPHCGAESIASVSDGLATVVVSFQVSGASPTEAEKACGRLMEIVQSLSRRTHGKPPHLFVVVREAHSVASSPVSPAAAAVWAFGRVIANEHPEWKTRLFDLPAEGAFVASLLAAEWMDANGDSEVAFRNDLRWTPRLVRSRVTESADDSSSRSTTRPNGPHRLEITSAGTLDKLAYRSFQIPMLAEGEVLIDVESAGLNFSDVLKAMGLYPGLGPGVVPLGIECSGRIAEVGPGVNDFAVGDEVMGVAPFSFASQAVTKAVGVVRKPKSISFDEAAAAPIAYLTAHYALCRLADLQPGERVLIHAGAGGVGLAAIAICQSIGAEVFATAGSDSKRNFLRELGVKHVFDSRTLDFADQIREATNGEGIDVVLNSLPGDAIPRSIELLRGYGRFVEIGKTDIYQNRMIGLFPFQNNLSYFAIDLDKMLRERPGYVQVLFREVMERMEDGRYRALPLTSFAAEDVVESFRYMQARRNIGKVVVQFSRIDEHEDSKLEPFRKDGTYVVTGGLGGLGLKLAEWLADNGAGRLLLIGRKAPSAEARKIVDRLATRGVEVLTASADVGVRSSIHEALTLATRPIRGVFHAAGVLDDGVIAQQTPDRLRRVMDPKARGAFNLHELLKDEPLDHFVLFSSVAPLFGSPGQSNYAAGNAYLDSLAAMRRFQGLPALSINWGPWAEVGMAARLAEDRMSERGVRPIPVAAGFELFGRLLDADVTQVGVVDVDWARMLSLYPNGGPALLRDLGGRIQTAPSAGRLRQTILATAESDRLGVLESHLVGQLAGILQLDPAQIDPCQPVNAMGLDSLMAIELKNGLETSLDIVMPMARFLEGPSVRELAAQSLSLLADLSAPEPSSAAIPEPLATSPENPVDPTSSPVEAAVEELSNADSEGWTGRVSIVETPLEELIARGSMAPVDAAVVMTVPASVLTSLGVNKSMIAGGLMQDDPMALGISGSSLGRSATILLPRFDEEVGDDPEALADEIAAAFRLAKSMGARAVALASPLAAATDGGRRLPASTTNGLTPIDARSATAAAVVLNIVGVLERTGRSLAQETVAFLGLDTLGSLAARLLLTSQPHLHSLLLCERKDRGAEASRLKQELETTAGFNGRIALAGTPDAGDASLYDATLIVCTAEMKSMIDVVRLRSGTIVVDASAPRGFHTQKALQRTNERRDVLFVEGVLLQAALPFEKIAFVPDVAESFRDNLVGRFTRRDPRLTTAATLAALFAAMKNPAAIASQAWSVDDGLRVLERLRELGFAASPPQLEDVPTTEPIVAEFRGRFSDARRNQEGAFIDADWKRLTAMPHANGHSERRPSEKIITPTND